MRMVLQIAKAELRNLFYSPVAWFLAIAFMALCGWYYSTGLINYAKLQDMMLANDTGKKDFAWLSMTTMLFTYGSSVFQVAIDHLYLFIPLLAMGLISREVNTGTIRLLYSSPVKLRQVVAGKFLAVLTFNLVLVGIIGCCLLATMFSIASADYGLMLSATLGFFLLTCTYTAIGLFMSSLTNYQIVSAIATFLVIMILTNIGGLWQNVDIVRDIVFSLFLAGRTDRMLKGLIVSKDVIYFIMVIFMFLNFTLLRLRAQREAKPWTVKLMRVLGVILIVLAVNYISAVPKFTRYWDTTAIDINTIRSNTQEMLQKMGDEPLEITIYSNLLAGAPQMGFPEARNMVGVHYWEKYSRFKPDITFKHVYYYEYKPFMDNGALAKNYPGKTVDELAAIMAEVYQVDVKDFMPPSQFKKIIDLEQENYQLIIQLKYRNREEFVRTYPAGGGEVLPIWIETTWPQEQNMAAAFKRLISPEKIPTMVFTNGNLERELWSDKSTAFKDNTVKKNTFESLINNGFNFDTVSLDNQDIPENTTTLVVADPKTALSEVSRQKIINYIDNGGNLWLLGEPGKQEVLNPILSHLGVEMLEGTLVEPSFHEMPHMVKPLPALATTYLSDEPQMLVMRRELESSYLIDTPKFLMPGVAALSYSDSNGFSKKPLLLTAESGTWLKKGKLVVDSAAVEYNPQNGDIKGAFPTALLLTRDLKNKQQRIIITGDADIFSNTRAKNMNGDVLFRSMAYTLDQGEFPVYLPFVIPADNKLIITADGVKKLLVLLVYILPSLLLVTGTVILIRRKRK